MQRVSISVPLSQLEGRPQKNTEQRGTDHIENLQLLCGHCNRIKGDRGQEYLISYLMGYSKLFKYHFKRTLNHHREMSRKGVTGDSRKDV